MTQQEWDDLRFGDVVQWTGPSSGSIYMFVSYGHGAKWGAPNAMPLNKADHNVTLISNIPDSWELRSRPNRKAVK